MTLRYFGANWGAPMLEGAVQDDTPVGAPCHTCREPIQLGDRGIWQMLVTPHPLRALYRPVHAECQLMEVLGHSFGVCDCTGRPKDRHSALTLWRRVHTWQAAQATRWH